MQKLSQTEELARELASHARRHTVTPEQIRLALEEGTFEAFYREYREKLGARM